MLNFRRIIGLAFSNAAMHLTRRDSRKTRNPADPAQAYLIARAEAKRARRANNLARNANWAWLRNDAHDSRNTFNPEFIA